MTSPPDGGQECLSAGGSKELGRLLEQLAVGLEGVLRAGLPALLTRTRCVHPWLNSTQSHRRTPTALPPIHRTSHPRHSSAQQQKAPRFCSGGAPHPPKGPTDSRGKKSTAQRLETAPQGTRATSPLSSPPPPRTPPPHHLKITT